MAECIVNDGQETAWKTLVNAVTVVADVQTLTVSGSPAGGTFKLTFERQETASIAFDAAAATVQTALQALSTVGASNMTVGGSAGGPWTVTAAAFLLGRPLPIMTLSTNALTGGTSPSVGIVHTTTGAGCIEQYYYLGLSQSTRETLGDTVTMSTINEVTGTGYLRVLIKTNSSELTCTLASGFWQFKTKVGTFTASSTDWTIARSIFLTNKPDTSGKVLSVRTLASSFTLANAQSTDEDLTEAFGDPA